VWLCLIAAANTPKKKGETSDEIIIEQDWAS
jgi:hypothetical protein